MSSRHAASQVCAIGTRAIAFMTPHCNTIEIMRLFATYHSAPARFTLWDATASAMTAWKGGNISSDGSGRE
jgi:hypothetical protein